MCAENGSILAVCDGQSVACALLCRFRRCIHTLEGFYAYLSMKSCNFQQFRKNQEQSLFPTNKQSPVFFGNCGLLNFWSNYSNPENCSTCAVKTALFALPVTLNPLVVRFLAIQPQGGNLFSASRADSGRQNGNFHRMLTGNAVK